ncbi:hypothetical protein [Nocardioides pantholopis]|uniref:hypothetical protein n=1 Tax=Nocardioides pantholopis TaxID=2483798 RepID=UPI000F098711|nr:hypothetical protein [Nocardioides pantholopis]
MPTLSVNDQSLRLTLTRTEKVLGLLRDLEVPLSAVTSVEVVPDGFAALRGIRAPGYALPRHRAIGTWRGRRKTLVSVRSGRPALRLTLDGQRYGEVLVAVEHPQDQAAELRDAVTGR